MQAPGKEALKKVGLDTQMKKKPGEMSGGQMQRVAIARAIVNDPDIILADEPTGALDTKTSIQVMDILKELSKDRLVIMVTHNPELAERYSTRIVRILDGKITGDSSPLTPEEIQRERDAEKKGAEKNRRIKKPSMSFATSFGLSLRNLFTKKGRTALTSFAGSIGIIGIALIYAVSQGTTAYIDSLQEDTLSSYPLTLQAQSMDLGALMEEFIGSAASQGDHERDAVYQKAMVYDLVNALNSSENIENDLRAFKTYLEEEIQNTEGEGSLHDAVNGVQYTYNTDLLVYTENVDGTILRSDSRELMQDLLLEYFGLDLSSMLGLGEEYGMTENMSALSSLSPAGSSMVLWQEMLPGENGKLVSPLLESQYEVVYGSWPTEYNEIVLVLDENNELDDMALYALGLKSEKEIDAIMEAAINQTEIETEQKRWSYEEICDMDFRTILNADCYVLDEDTGLYVDLRNTEAGLRYLYDNGISLKVSGIIRPSEDAVSTMLDGSIGYTSELTEYMIEQSKDSPAVQAQQASPSTDIFTGLPFQESTADLTEEEKEQEFRDSIAGLDETEKGEAYVRIMSIPAQEEIDEAVSQAVSSADRGDMEDALTQGLAAQAGLGETDIQQYLSAMSDEELTELYTQMAEEQFKAQYAAQVQAQMESMDAAQKAAALDAAMESYTSGQCAVYYDEILEFSESSYEANLQELGYVELDNPSAIHIYASTFENKDMIEEAIADYNETVDDLAQIQYTDYVDLMMSTVTSIINAITYVLIAFVAVSLIVSSIMIGVITLISVQERTKEIGILRAVGASKRNVSSMFNAETLIIGFTSGILGVAITYLLCIPVNRILHHFTGISALQAYLPPEAAVVLVLISMTLTLFSGIIPSRSAAKKDPVVALRTE